MWNVTSPDGHISVCVSQAEDGSIHMSLSRDSIPVLSDAVLGLCLRETGDLKAVFLDAKETTFHETYALPVGKAADYESDYTEMLMRFCLGTLRYKVCLRASNMGIAFRYAFEGTGTVTLQDEITLLTFPEDVQTMLAQDLIPTYEGPYLPRAWAKMIGQDYGMPLLMQSAQGPWILISEAEVLSKNGQWPSSHFLCPSMSSLRIARASEDHGAEKVLELPFASPWRILTVTKDLNALVQSHLCYDMNPACTWEDTSWVKPARALWAWWEYENGAQLYSESKAYIDYAASIGLEAVVLDCPWDGNWVPRLCTYAHEKGVQLWLWTSRHRVDTWETASTLIPLWASWGIDGLKIDFFENDSCDTMQIYGMLAGLMEKYHLMINFHGATKPMGEGRTWPHFMTSEGIMGLEHYKWSDMPDSVHNCTVPFTRNVSGPMDYTPLGFSNPNRNTTHGHQLALPVVFESGVTHYSLSIFYMEPWAGTRFLRRTRSKYDECRLLSGYPGRDVVMMRRAGNEYVIGAITVDKKTISVPLDFLPDGDWEAEIYEDDPSDHSIVMHTETVNNGSCLSLKLLKNGGAGIYITRTLQEPKTGICGGWADTHVQQLFLDGAELHGGCEKVSVHEHLNGYLLKGMLALNCTAEVAGLYTLRITYTSTAPWHVKVSNGADTTRSAIPSGCSHWDLRVHDVVIRLHQGMNRLTVCCEDSEAPVLTDLRLIDNHPQPVYRLPITEAVLGRGAEIAAARDGTPEAVRLGMDADITYEHVCVGKPGTYILAVEYTGGDARDLSVEVNGVERVDTYLHPTSGWGFQHWNAPEYKEVLVHLSDGENRIRLFNDHGSMSHIRGITLTLDIA